MLICERDYFRTVRLSGDAIGLECLTDLSGDWQLVQIFTADHLAEELDGLHDELLGLIYETLDKEAGRQAAEEAYRDSHSHLAAANRRLYHAMA